MLGREWWWIESGVGAKGGHQVRLRRYNDTDGERRVLIRRLVEEKWGNHVVGTPFSLSVIRSECMLMV